MKEDQYEITPMDPTLFENVIEIILFGVFTVMFGFDVWLKFCEKDFFIMILAFIAVVCCLLGVGENIRWIYKKVKIRSRKKKEKTKEKSIDYYDER